jgi:hypothetical protein
MRWQMMLGPAVLVLLAGCGEKGRDTIFEPTIVDELTVAPAQAELLVGEEVQLRATPVDRDGNVVWSERVTWTSSDSTVARVTNGYVKAMGPGSATITVTCQAIERSVVVTVHGWVKEMDGNGGSLHGIWGSSASDVFAVGSTCDLDAFACWGTILHSDGIGWARMETPSLDQELNGVWGSSATDVFAVGGGGVILHYDGTGWIRMQSGTTDLLRAVWGSSADDVFAVGADPTFQHPVVLHYDGRHWAPVTPADVSRIALTGVWGSSGTDVFVVGFMGTILHYDGIAWARMSLPLADGLLGVWGTSGTNVFAVGVDGMLLHYDGAVWNFVRTTITHDLMAIGGTADNDVYVVGAANAFFGGSQVILHYDGMAWSELKKVVTPGLFGVWAVADEVFAVGPGPTIVHGKER